MMLLLVAALQAAGQSYVIDKVCLGTQRHYRIDGEAGSTYLWQLTDGSGNPVALNNPSGISFTTTDPVSGLTKVGSEVIILWNQPGSFQLAAIQYSSFGCDTLQQGEVQVFALPTATAGNPLTICAGNSITLTDASATNYAALLWSTSGDGHFDSNTALHPTYTPGANDQFSGSVTLTLTAEGLGASDSCAPGVSSLTVTITNTLIASVSILAEPTMVCAGTTVDFTAISVNGGSAPTYQWKVNGINSGFNINKYSYPPTSGDRLTVTMTSNETCVSGNPATSNELIMSIPGAPEPPQVGPITAPTCDLATGSVTLIGLPATGSWTLTQNPRGATTTGTGTSTIISGLTAGTYTFSVTDVTNCSSVPSEDVVIPEAPGAPVAPQVGPITAPTCDLATGNVTLTGLPVTGTWTLTQNPGGTTITGSGTSTIISGLSAGTFTFTVTNEAACSSGPSSDVVIPAAPGAPVAPQVGPITAPTCELSAGSVTLTGLPATGTWTLTPKSGRGDNNGEWSIHHHFRVIRRNIYIYGDQ